VLYILYGPDTHSRKTALDKLKKKLDTDGALATNTTTFEAAKTTPQEVIAACNTAPFLGATRLVILEGALSAAGKPKKGAKKPAKPRAATRSGRLQASKGEGQGGEANGSAAEEAPDPWTTLADYVPSLPETTTLVLLDTTAPATGLIAALKRYAEVQEFKLPDEKQLAGYVMNRAKQMGLKLDGPAAKLLADLIGPDIWMLASELEKLHTYANGDIVRERDVHALVSRAKEHKGYELSGAVIDRNGSKAARILQELFEDDEPQQVLLATVIGAFRRVAVTKAMIEAGESDTAIMSRLKISPQALSYRLDEAARYTWADIRRAYALTIQAERDVKQGLMDGPEGAQLALELLVQTLASPPTRTPARA
jgi:DNA polymerase III delta subunit